MDSLKHAFFVLLNGLVGVHETSKNLLRRIGVREFNIFELKITDLLLSR